VNAVTTLSDVLSVQRLMDVADEMNDKLGSLRPPPRPQSRIEQLRCVVLKRADNATIGLAIPIEVDATICGRVILGVDEVEVLGEATPFGVSNAVCPGRDTREVVLCIVVQQLLEISRRVLLDEVAGDVGDCDMTETYAVRSISDSTS
jgi:hypothetical protein